MSVKFANGYGKSTTKTINVEIAGNCRITNYDTRERNSAYKGDLCVMQKDNKSSIIVDSNQTGSKAVMSDAKFSVFEKIAGMDGNTKNLTQLDIKKAKQNYNSNQSVWEEMGVTYFGYDEKSGVAHLKMGVSGVLRIDFETKGDKNQVNADSKVSKNNASVETKKQAEAVNAPKQQKTGNYIDFLNHLGQRESSGCYTKKNSCGYLGKYQMGEMALVDAGYINRKKSYDNTWRRVSFTKYAKSKGVTTPSKFLHNAAAQEDAQLRFKKSQWKSICNKDLNSYIGKKIKGIKITESALLGGAHLVGVDNVEVFLKSKGKIDPKDKNGVHASEYMRLFCGYNVEGITKTLN